MLDPCRTFRCRRWTVAGWRSSRIPIWGRSGQPGRRGRLDAFGIVAIHEGADAPRDPTTKLSVDLALEPQADVRPGLLIVEFRKRLTTLFAESVRATHLSFATRGLATLNLPEFIYALLPLSSYWRMLLERYRRTDLMIDREWRDLLARVELQGRPRSR